MRLGQAVRDARGQHQRVEPGHVGLGHAQPGGRLACGGRVVPHRHIGAHRHQGARRRQAVAAEADDSEALAREQGGGETHRIFNVPSPISARIMAMIQKRMTMVGSDQPFFSK